MSLLAPKRHAITAAAFANDHLACGALMEAQATGIDVPGRLAMLGFGDFPIGRQLRPALSTVRPARAEIAAGDFGGDRCGELCFAVQLVERASTVAAR